MPKKDNTTKASPLKEEEMKLISMLLNGKFPTSGIDNINESNFHDPDNWKIFLSIRDYHHENDQTQNSKIEPITLYPYLKIHEPAETTKLFSKVREYSSYSTASSDIKGIEHGELNVLNNWPKPIPLLGKTEPEPYPLDALPNTIRAAVTEVQNFTKAPISLIASSALAALSLAIQAHIDVKRAEKLTGPAGLFLLTIADSGERKSTCDGFFMKAIRDYERQQAEEAQASIKNHQAAKEIWEAKHSGIKEKMRHQTKSGKSTQDTEAVLLDLEHNKSKPPKIPRLIYSDATPEALKWSLAMEWPSGGVISSEAGIVFGAHGMGRDSIMRNLATLNQLWDGTDIATDRRTSESFILRGARLTIALQVQEATLLSFFNQSGDLARGTGFLARFLIAWPESTQGSRFYTEPPESWPALEAFNRRISVILNQPIPVDEQGILTPNLLSMTPAAKNSWISFYNSVEKELCAGGKLYDIRDIASKIADNAARLAALFQIFEHGTSNPVELNAFDSASKIAEWHLHEAQRFLGELALPPELSNAVRLDRWLIDYCKREQTSIVPRREIQRNVTPSSLRQKTALDAALDELMEAERARFVQDGRRKEIHVNPVLLEGGVQ